MNTSLQTDLRAQPEENSGGTRDWRLCVDFGTAESKAVLGCQTAWTGSDGPLVIPLPIGHFAGNADPLLVPSAIFIEHERMFFGPAALSRSLTSTSNREPLRSFKMLLGAPDLQVLLETSLKRSVDPDGRFNNRSILTLYIAYLSALIGACFENDARLNHVKDRLRWRYSRPEWPAARVGVHDNITKSIFLAGIHAGGILRQDFLSRDGVEIGAALAAIHEAPTTPEDLIEGGIFEAYAAGAAHAGVAALASPVVMVFDMGAGTTDIAGFILEEGSEGGVMRTIEIPNSRRSFTHAGDELDRIIMNAFIERAGIAKDVRGQAALWRLMAPSIRDFKRQAFIQEKFAIRFREKSVVLARKQLESSSYFIDFVSEIEKHFQASLATVAAAAKARKTKTVSLILAGGGSALPFVQDMAKKAERSWRKDARVRLEPLTPAWACSQTALPGLAQLFPQLEVAIGGVSPMVAVETPVKRESELGLSGIGRPVRKSF